MIRTLNHAIDDLVNPSRILLFKDENGHNIRGDVPALIQQLEDAIARDGNGEGGGRMRARPPIAVGVMQLVTEIATKCATAVIKRHGKHLNSITANLRRIAADRANLQPGDPDLRNWTLQVDTWTRKAKTTLGIEPKYPKGLRGMPCPNCGATHAHDVDDAGETVRVPALQFAWSEPAETAPDQLAEDRTMRAVQCVMCQATWWSGAQLWQLQAQIAHVIETNLTHETLAHNT